jgi:hypothetical protein
MALQHVAVILVVPHQPMVGMSPLHTKVDEQVRSERQEIRRWLVALLRRINSRQEATIRLGAFFLCFFITEEMGRQSPFYGRRLEESRLSYARGGAGL